MRIAWFSALPIADQFKGLRSAYFSRLVLPLLREQFEIELFHNSFEKYEDYDCFHYLAAFKRHEEKPFDAFVYQLEDSPLCQFARVHALLKPGVVYFHDFVFTSFGPEPILNSPWEKIQKIFSEAGKDWPIRDEKHFQSGPLAHREGTFAPVALFSNSAQHTQFKDLRLDNLVKDWCSYYLPLPVVESTPSAFNVKERLRIAYCGSPRIEHRAHKLLSALADSDFHYELIWMTNPKDLPQVEGLLSEFEVTNVRLVQDWSPESWQALSNDYDVAAHFAFSVYEQNEPYLGMSLMAGKPVLVTDFGPSQALPNDIVFKVEPGDSEAFQIQKVLQLLSSGDINWDGQVASDYAKEAYHLGAVADDFAAVLESNKGLLEKIKASWTEFEAEAKQALLSEARAVANAVPEKIHYKNLSIERLKDDNLVFDTICEPVFKELGWL